MMNKEIERKFLLSRNPVEKGYFDNFKTKTIYAIVEHNSFGKIKSELRIRRTTRTKGDTIVINPRDVLTFKSGGDLERTEIEGESSLDFYDKFELELNGINPIQCDVYFYKYTVEENDTINKPGEYTIEVAVVDDKWVYCEVEFDNAEDAKNFKFPWDDVLVKEITYEPKYKMANYWSNRDIFE